MATNLPRGTLDMGVAVVTAQPVFVLLALGSLLQAGSGGGRWTVVLLRAQLRALHVAVGFLLEFLFAGLRAYVSAILDLLGRKNTDIFVFPH